MRDPLRFLRGNYSRLILTVVAIATGVASVCSNNLMSRAVMAAFADVIDTTAGTASLQVRRGDGGTFPKQVAIDVARVAGVGQVVPVVTAIAFTTDGSGEMLAVHGYDLVDDAAAAVYGVKRAAHGSVRGARALLPGSVILTEAFAARAHVAAGSRIDFDTSSGRQRFTVAGLVAATGLGRLNGGNLIVMDLYAAQLAFARRGEINRVDVVVRPGADAEQVAGRLRAVLPPGVQVESPAEQKRVLEKATQSIHELLRVFMVGGLLAAFLIAFNSLSALCEARLWELSVLRAIGLRRRAMWRHLLLEGVTLGLVGSVIGIPMGILYAQALLPRIVQATALDTNSVVPASPLGIDGSAIVLAAALGLVTAVAAAALPARRASRVEVVESLRGGALESRETTGRLSWLVRALVAGSALVAIGVEVDQESAVWGIVAASLVVLATALLARPLTGALGRVLARGLERLAGRSARLAVAQIIHRPRRAALMVAMIGVGVGSVLWLWMLARSFELSVVDTLTQSCRADLVVSSAHLGSAFIEAPVSDALLARLRDVPGVGAAVGIRDVEVPYGDGTITLDAADPAYFLNPAFGRLALGAHLPDVWETVARGDAVIASANFLRNMRVRVGDTLTLSTPSGLVRLPIAGVASHFFSPRGTLTLSRALYARLWGDEQISRSYVLVTAGVAPSIVRAAIAATLGRAYSLRILSAAELIDYFASRVRAAFAGVYVHAAGVLLVVFVGIAETLIAAVVARRREMGTLRVVGVQRRGLRHLVLTEAVLLGGIGFLLAGASGFAQGALWVTATFPYLFGFVLALHVPYYAATICALLTLAVCVIAALLPAQHAARLQPAVALRYE